MENKLVITEETFRDAIIDYFRLNAGNCMNSSYKKIEVDLHSSHTSELKFTLIIDTSAMQLVKIVETKNDN